MSDASTGPASDAAIFTVPLGTSFLDEMASAILRGDLPRPGGTPPELLDLPDITILVPTRRAARALQDAFLRAGDGRALLLPQIRPIGEADEDRLLISGLADLESFDGDLSIPPAVPELERRLVITQLVQRWSDRMREAGTHEADHDLARQELVAAAGARTPAQAAHLAQELCRLIDMLETEGVSLDRLDGLVPDTLSAHWQQTLDFLHIITAWWPEHLKAVDKLSPADRRNRLIRAEAARLASSAHDAPVIVAGVTGSIPATAELMTAVSALPQGAIVLPGLDTMLDDESWEIIKTRHPEHPQYGLAHLMARVGVARSAVRTLAKVPPDAATEARAGILSEAMRPAETTDRWHTIGERLDADAVRDSLAGITVLAAPTQQDEAEAISLILRHAAETPGRTAALITPDRLLARRVAIRLDGLGIRVDDSAGRPFAKTVPGSFLDLVVDVSAQSFAPKPLAALLKHPLTRLGMGAFEVRRAARALEVIAFRTPYLGYGIDGIEAAVERAVQEVADRTRRGQAVGRLWDEDWQSARDLVARLREAYKPLASLSTDADGDELPLKDLVEAHIAVAEALARTGEEDEAAEQLWRDEAGQTAALLFANLVDPALTTLHLPLADYPDFYRALIGSEAVRPSIPTHPRISIWGPFEARLQKPDVVILGSLNEGTWPGAADPGPWLNRPMRGQLGLPLPEERIGHAAHDVTQQFGAEEVYLTRAEKVEGDPTVPSRWLLRLEAVLAGLGLTFDSGEREDAPRHPWLGWARGRDLIEGKATPVTPPEPRPPVALRPRRLSVSAIETWIANPYALFANRILSLEALPPLGQDPDASLRGSIVHEALRRFIAAHPRAPAADAAAELMRFSTEIFEGYKGHPRIRAFWMSRFERFAQWFGAHDATLRDGADLALAELTGQHVLDAPAGPFTLTARADRIDVGKGGLIITDYKTGAHLGTLKARAEKGAAPQLLLEALIAIEGAFERVPAGAVSVAGLRYISASGGEPPGQIVDVRLDDVAKVARQTGQDLAQLVARYDDPATPYKALRRSSFDYTYDDFAHLSRVLEWSASDNGEDA